MFREMRRKRQLLLQDETVKILNENKSGVLGVFGDEGYPYTVPMSYIYSDGKLYFHCAKQGHKMDAIKMNHKVSFTVIDKDEIIPEKFTTYFRSAIAFGTARIVEDDDERLQILRNIVTKYSDGYQDKGEEEIKREWNIVCLVEMTIDHLTGKESIELVNRR